MVSHIRDTSDDEVIGLRQSVNVTTTKIVTMSKKVNTSTMKKLEHLIPLTDDMNTRITSHTAHQEWITKI